MQPAHPMPPLTPLPRIDASMVRPARAWFVVAGAVAIGGIIIGVVIGAVGVAGFIDRVDGFTRADVPATFDVEITETGGYSIYHEYPGADDSVWAAAVPTVDVTGPSGQDVLLEPYSSTVTYAMGDHEGVGIYTFRADEPGTYRIDAGGGVGGVAVGRGLGSGLVASILIAFTVAGLSVVGGAVIAIVVGVRRSRHRRELLPPPVPGAWGPVAPPGAGAPPPGWGAPQAGWGAPPPQPPYAGAPPAQPPYAGAPGPPVDAPPADRPPSDAPPRPG